MFYKIKTIFQTIFVLSLFSLSPLLMSQDGLGEKSPEDFVSMNALFAKKVSSTFNDVFNQNVEKYNEADHTVKSVLKELNKTKEYKEEVDQYGTLTLPKIEHNKHTHSATIKIKETEIKFSSSTLFEGYIIINDEKYELSNELTKDEFNKKSHQSTRNTKEAWVKKITKVLHLIVMNKADAAQEDDAFEVLIFSTVVALKYDFEDSWCFRQSCRDNLGRKNFDKVMDEIEELAGQCQVGDGHSFVYNVADFPKYGMKDNLEQNLEDFFDELPSSELNCQKLVENFHKDKIEEASLSEARGYGAGQSSYDAYMNEQANEDGFSNYISKTCRPYAELRNCMLQNHSQARRIHNSTRGAKERDSYTESYQADPQNRTHNR